MSVNEAKNLGGAVVDRKTEQGQKPERYGVVVFTGRHKILDYHKAIPGQIATADDEQSALLITQALNDSDARVRLLNVSLDLLIDVLGSRAGQRFSTIGLSRIKSHIADLRAELAAANESAKRPISDRGTDGQAS